MSGDLDVHCGNVFAWEGIRGVRNEQTCLESRVSARSSDAPDASEDGEDSRWVVKMRREAGVGRKRETYLANSTVARHDTLPFVHSMVSICSAL